MAARPSTFAASEDALHEAARQATGLDDFGDDEYLEGLRTLLAAYDEEADPSAAGAQFLWGQAVETLQARLYSERGWKQHPDCRKTRIDRPLIIVGLPRTGTTALHRLMAQDPDVQALELWLADAPKVRPPPADWAADPQYRSCAERVRARNEASPDMDAIHPMAADLVDECWHLMSQSFANCTYECNATIPSYSHWYASHDMRAAYRRHRDNLNLIGHGQSQRWLLKDANHLFHLEALLDIYPDACIAYTHRDPVKLIPSVCSLLRAGRASLDARLDLHQLGRSQLDLWERGIFATMEVRRRNDPARFLDLHFSELVERPLESIRKIYDYFGFELSAEAERRMRLWREANPPDRGAHIYHLDDFGLVEGEILERFAAYVEAFDIPRG